MRQFVSLTTCLQAHERISELENARGAPKIDSSVQSDPVPSSDAQCVVDSEALCVLVEASLQTDGDGLQEDPRLQIAAATVRVEHNTSSSFSVELLSCAVQTDAETSAPQPQPEREAAAVAARDEHSTQTDDIPPPAPPQERMPRARGPIVEQVRLPTLDYSPLPPPLARAECLREEQLSAPTERPMANEMTEEQVASSPEEALLTDAASTAAARQRTALIAPSADASTQFEATDAQLFVAHSAAITQIEAPNTTAVLAAAPAPVSGAATRRNVKVQVRPSQMLDLLRDANVQTEAVAPEMFDLGELMHILPVNEDLGDRASDIREQVDAGGEQRTPTVISVDREQQVLHPVCIKAT